MTFRLFDAPLREPSQFVGFAGNRIDRQSENRSDDCVEIALKDPAARILPMRDGRLYLKLKDNGAFDPWFDLAESDGVETVLSEAILLGYADGQPILAAPAAMASEALPETIKAIDHRSVYIQRLIDEAALGALAQGAALLSWNASHRFCSKCGNPSEMRAGGYKRHCPACGSDHFPRTDPVVIMLALHEGKCLLGRQAAWPKGMFSALAGFLEPGETIEEACARELKEEAGLTAVAVRYHSSQPWPWPSSLMMGLTADVDGGDAAPDQTELEEVRWFSKDEAAQLIKGELEGLFAPPPLAIAHQLIKSWAEG